MSLASLRLRRVRRFVVSLLVAAPLSFAAVAYADEPKDGHPAPAGHGAQQAPHGAGHAAKAVAHAVHHDDHLDWKTIGYHGANLAVFLVGLVLVARKPLRSFLASRRAVIAEGLEEAGRLRSEAATKLATLESKLSDLAGERAKILDGYREEGQLERTRLTEAANRGAENMRREVVLMLEQETRSLRRHIRNRAADAAVALAEAVIKAEITAQDRVRLADEYIEQLKAAASPR